MDEPLYGYVGLHHDVGFVWLLSSVANYRITGNAKSMTRGLIAASFLASRYNPSYIVPVLECYQIIVIE